MGAAGSIDSDKPLAHRLAQICRDKLNLKVAEPTLSKNGGSEDYSYMINRVQEQGGQGVFMRLHTTLAGPAHNRKHDLDEQYIPKGIMVFCAAAYDLMN